MRRQLQARSARKALLWGGLVFAGLQLSMILSTELWLPDLRDPPFSCKINRLRERLRRADAVPARTHAGNPQRPYVVVMLGSSRVADGLRGSTIEPELRQRLGRPVILYNLGIRADGPLNEALNLERLLAAGIRPDLLLVEVLPALLSKQSEEQLKFIYAERLSISDLARLRRFQFPVSRLQRLSWAKWGLPWYAHRLEILSSLLPDLLPRQLRQNESRFCDDSGWQEPEYDTSPQGREKARSYAWGCYHSILGKYALGNLFCPMLRQLLDRCHEERIPAALVLMPESESFRCMYCADAQRQLDEFLKKLTAPHGNPVIDARTWVAEEHFIDGHHLLATGAAQFSQRLGREALLPMLRNLPQP